MPGFKLPRLRPSLLRPSHRAAIVAVAMMAIPVFGSPALARGPDNIADVAEKVINAVVNVSSSQSVDNRNSAAPALPPGSPFEEFFNDFFKNRPGQGQQ